MDVVGGGEEMVEREGKKGAERQQGVQVDAGLVGRQDGSQV